MILYECEGWIEKFRIESWGAEIVIRTEFSDKEVKFPQHILFEVTSKNLPKIPTDLMKDDKVRIKFFPWLKEGVSKATGKPYAIQTLMLSEIAVAQKVPRDERIDAEEALVDTADDDALPF